MAVRGRLFSIAMLVLVSVTVLAACADEPGSTTRPDESTLANPTPPAGTPPPLSVGHVRWTTSVSPETGAPVDEIAAVEDDSQQVIAMVYADSFPADVEITARWTIDGSAIPETESDAIVTDQAQADVWLAWTLSRTGDQPWPQGMLGIIIEAAGTPVVEGEIPIIRGEN